MDASDSEASLPITEESQVSSPSLLWAVTNDPSQLDADVTHREQNIIYASRTGHLRHNSKNSDFSSFFKLCNVSHPKSRL